MLRRQEQSFRLRTDQYCLCRFVRRCSLGSRSLSVQAPKSSPNSMVGRSAPTTPVSEPLPPGSSPRGTQFLESHLCSIFETRAATNLMFNCGDDRKPPRTPTAIASIRRMARRSSIAHPFAGALVRRYRSATLIDSVQTTEHKLPRRVWRTFLPPTWRLTTRLTNRRRRWRSKRRNTAAARKANRQLGGTIIYAPKSPSKQGLRRKNQGQRKYVGNKTTSANVAGVGYTRRL